MRTAELPAMNESYTRPLSKSAGQRRFDVLVRRACSAEGALAEKRAENAALRAENEQLEHDLAQALSIVETWRRNAKQLKRRIHGK